MTALCVVAKGGRERRTERERESECEVGTVKRVQCPAWPVSA